MRANRSLSETKHPGPQRCTNPVLEFVQESGVLHLSTAGNFIPEISVTQPGPLSGPISFLGGGAPTNVVLLQDILRCRFSS